MRLLLGLFALTVFHRRASVTPFREFVCDERSKQIKTIGQKLRLRAERVAAIMSLKKVQVTLCNLNPLLLGKSLTSVGKLLKGSGVPFRLSVLCFQTAGPIKLVHLLSPELRQPLK